MSCNWYRGQLLLPPMLKPVNVIRGWPLVIPSLARQWFDHVVRLPSLNLKLDGPNFTSFTADVPNTDVSCSTKLFVVSLIEPDPAGWLLPSVLNGLTSLAVLPFAMMRWACESW